MADPRKPLIVPLVIAVFASLAAALFVLGELGVVPTLATASASALATFLLAAGTVVSIGVAMSRARRDSALAAETSRHDRQAVDETLGRVRATALESEQTGRRLAARIGDTLGGIARIASEATAAHHSATDLSDRVAQGASAMEEIQASVESLTRRIGTQKTLVDQSAAAVEEMTASIASVASVARAKRTVAEQLADLTEEGSGTLAVSDRLISEVSESVDEVANTIRVINTIAAQTNLLAMNAAIEAAHAGDYGRGFAVVAAEIRSLAESTAGNASQINQRLAALTSSIVDARGASAKSGRTFQAIQEEAKSVSAAFSEITMSTEELSAGSTQITEATSRLRDIATETTTSSEEMRIGANEVTAILISTRESSRETAEAMDAIGRASRAISSASSTISARSAENNRRIVDLLDIVASGSAQGAVTATEVRRRLDLANRVLDHFSWMGALRALIDGRPLESPVPAESECETGAWLAHEASTVVDDPQTLERLRTAHAGFHAAAEEIATLARAGAAEPEPTFDRLLEHARTLTEILVSYEEEAARWSPALSVGVEVFDEHHRKLFELVNHVYDAMRNGADEATLGGVFDELLAYTRYHFDAEERAFDEFAYPHADTHRQKHAALVDRAKSLRRDLEEGKQMVAVEVMQFLRDWVTGHIQGEDMQYAEYFRSVPVDKILDEKTREVQR